MWGFVSRVGLFEVNKTQRSSGYGRVLEVFNISHKKFRGRIFEVFHTHRSIGYTLMSHRTHRSAG